jgi:hypothetical protein
MLTRISFLPNVAQRGDALVLLQSLSDGCTPLVFFDPQHRAVLDKLKFRQRRRPAAWSRRTAGDDRAGDFYESFGR